MDKVVSGIKIVGARAAQAVYIYRKIWLEVFHGQLQRPGDISVSFSTVMQGISKKDIQDIRRRSEMLIISALLGIFSCKRKPLKTYLRAVLLLIYR